MSSPMRHDMDVSGRSDATSSSTTSVQNHGDSNVLNASSSQLGPVSSPKARSFYSSLSERFNRGVRREEHTSEEHSHPQLDPETQPLLSSQDHGSQRGYLTNSNHEQTSRNTTTMEIPQSKRESLTPSVSPPIKGRESLTDEDALRLAELGYDQAMTRKFSVWSILGIGFSLTNSWFGLSAAMVTGINSGGTALIMYGVLIVAVISSCIAITLSELASALPSAGGQYYWAHELAPKKYKNFASYFVGWFSWAGSIFTSASVALSLSFAIVGCYQLSHPDYEIETWAVFVCYQLVNAVAAIFNCFGRFLPITATCTLYISLISFTVILITVPSVAPVHQPAKFVFATFINNTGWESGGIAFIVGLINTNWPFACLDSATHLAEEVPKPERNIPIAICGTVAIGFVTAWFFAMAMFFSLVGDFDTLVGSPTGVPILALFNSALTGRSAQVAGAIILESLIIATGFGCQIASHTWQSRLVWSFARDGGVPYSSYLSKVNRKLDVPLRAHLVSCVLVALVGCLYLGSYTAFNSMVTACIVLLYISYAVPVAFLLFHRGRSNLKPGPFWLGKVGMLANVVLLCWTAFTLVMYSFPYTQPVTAGNMNYVSAVYGVVTTIVLVDWFARGRRGYGQVSREERKESAVEDVLERRASAGSTKGIGRRNSASETA